MSTAPVRTPDPRPVRSRRPLGGGRIAMVVIGSVLALFGLALFGLALFGLALFGLGLHPGP